MIDWQEVFIQYFAEDAMRWEWNAEELLDIQKSLTTFTPAANRRFNFSCPKHGKHYACHRVKKCRKYYLN